MLDINQTLLNAHHAGSDPEGNLFNLERWSPQIASQLALSEGMVLEDEHWEIIYFLRERYRIHGNNDNARLILRELQDAFAPDSGREYLYELFPGGPVNQGSRIAGLPIPPHAYDASFGSVM
jgi:tRNA 2-thiouridine synthesizing protein E